MKSDIIYYCDIFNSEDNSPLFSTYKFKKPRVGDKVRKHTIKKLEMVCKDLYKIFV